MRRIINNMKKLNLFPNEQFLHSVEDELYQYAVDHPGITWDLFWDGTTPDFDQKMRDLISQDDYVDACEERSMEMAKKYAEAPMKVIEEFVKKFPQWAPIFYY